MANSSLSNLSQEHNNSRWLSVGVVGLGCVEETCFTCSQPLAPLPRAPFGGEEVTEVKIRFTHDKKKKEKTALCVSSNRRKYGEKTIRDNFKVTKTTKETQVTDERGCFQ